MFFDDLGFSVSKKQLSPKKAIKPSGKFIKKINRQLKSSIIKPPRKGPITGPASSPNVQADKALLLFSFEKISITNA